MLIAAIAPDEGGARRPSLLLVEDHQDTRQMYAEYLASMFDVSQASDGQEALESVRRHPPDIVITDLSLPKLDGFELVSAIRQDPALQHIPVICISGYGGHAHEGRARAAGCDRILQKPCMPDALAETASGLVLAVRRRRQQR